MGSCEMDQWAHGFPVEAVMKVTEDPLCWG